MPGTGPWATPRYRVSPEGRGSLARHAHRSGHQDEGGRLTLVGAHDRDGSLGFPDAPSREGAQDGRGEPSGWEEGSIARVEPGGSVEDYQAGDERSAPTPVEEDGR